MKKIVVLGLFLCLSLPVLAQKEYGLRFSSLVNEELTLESAIRLGLENNSDFLAAQQEIIIAEQKVKESKLRFLPEIALQGTATWHDLDYPMVLPESVANRFIPNNDLLSDDTKHQFLGAGVTATQYLYAGGRLRNTLKMAQANLKQAQSRYESVKNATVLDIKKSFFRLLWAQHTAQLAEQVKTKADTYYRAIKPSPWEKIKTQYLFAALTSRKNEADNELQKARLAMLVSLNKELNAQIRVKGDFKPVQLKLDLPYLNLWSMEFRPELKTAIYALELNSLAVDLAISRRYPDLVLMGSYEQLGFDSLNNVNKQLSLAVRLPLQYNISTQTAQRKAEQKQSSLRRAAIEDKIRVQVAENYASLIFWQNEAQTRQDTWEDVQRLLVQAEKAGRPNLDALEALEAYYQTGLAYYESVRNNLTSKAGLEWAIGKDL